MPDLHSRMDNANWLTPAIGDILDQGAATTGDGSMRETILTLQRELDEHNTPARIVNTRPMPTFTLFIARPSTVGKSDNRHTVSHEEIEKSVADISEKTPEWQLGFMPELRDDSDAVGILLRTENHQSLSLRRMMVQRTFVKHPSMGAFVGGVTLQQQLIVRDLFESSNVIILGSAEERQHLIKGMMLTLLTLNTPGEVRLALMGESAAMYQSIMGIPHALGRMLTEASAGQRLLSGFLKEVIRRKKTFDRAGVETLDALNEKLLEKEKPVLPRIVLVIDSVTDTDWEKNSSEWLPLMMRLIKDGKAVGIHMIIAGEDLDPPRSLRSLYRAVDDKIVLRSVAGRLRRHLPHETLDTFVNAYVVNDSTREVIPVETYVITDLEMKRAVEYWRNNVRQRLLEATRGAVSGRTGVTGLLNNTESAESLQKPPVPQKPPQQVLKKAMQALGGRMSQMRSTGARLATAERQAVVEDTDQDVRPPIETPPNEDILETQENAAASEAETVYNNGNGQIVTETPQPVSDKTTQADELLQSDTLDDSPISPTVTETIETIITPDMDAAPAIIQQAQALAAYLGWLSKGALMDIFGISPDDAITILRTLKHEGVLEDSDSRTPRYLRLTGKQDG